MIKTQRAIETSLSYSGKDLPSILKYLYYTILTDKRISESSESLDKMGLDGMLELYEMLCVRDAMEHAVMPDSS